jgi:purine-binding chemotaxis protein CheW
MVMRPSLSRQEPSQRSLVAFIVGEVRYAIDIAQVREIVTPLPLTILPHAPQGLAGVADHRDQVVPIVDLRIRFNLPERTDATKKVKWILVGIAEKTVGLVVDDVLGVLRIPSTDFRSAPDLGSGDDKRAISSVTTHDKRLVFILELGKLDTGAILDTAALIAAQRDAGEVS